MRAARMYGYQQPLVREDVKAPEPAGEKILVKAAPAGMALIGSRIKIPLFPLSPGGLHTMQIFVLSCGKSSGH
jgi:hypothetical protein